MRGQFGNEAGGGSHLRKLREHSVATALASRVFPVPGAPYSSTPERRSPAVKSSGWRSGS